VTLKRTPDRSGLWPLPTRPADAYANDPVHAQDPVASAASGALKPNTARTRSAA
jgi:hypothetical protein